MIKAKQFETVVVTDPDSGLPVEVVMLKMETGAIVGVDASFLDQDVGPVMSPYDPNVELDFD